LAAKLRKVGRKTKRNEELFDLRFIMLRMIAGGASA
jgi:hypothetical protein